MFLLALTEQLVNIIVAPSQYPSGSSLLTTVETALQEDVRTADRITEVLTRTVPWQFPGRLLRAVADASPASVEKSRLTQATIAVEYACLHQYLHAIPRTEGHLDTPAADSAYAGDPVAAMLDGDSLQACAFSRLERAGGDETVLSQCYERLAADSVACYEQASQQGDTSLLDLSPLAGVGAYLGARYGGHSQQTATALRDAATALGETMPFETPSALSTGTAETADATAKVATLLEDTGTIGDRIERLIRTEQTAVSDQQ